MAIYHLNAQIIGRKAGRSSVACAAYRSGEELVDARTGETHRFAGSERVAHAEIVAPSDAPDWARDRGQLWNSAEQRERRKDSQLAREFEVSLPRELSLEQQKDLVRDWIREEFTPAGAVADLAIHTDPKNHNPHCHIMTTMRPVSSDGWGAQKLRQWEDRAQIDHWRKSWAEHTNRALELAGRDERVDHRTLKAQGIERQPMIKEGPAARRLEERGLVSDRMSINRQIREWNRQLRETASAAIDTMRRKLQAKPADRAKPAYVEALRDVVKARPAPATRDHDVVSKEGHGVVSAPPEPAAAVKASKPKKQPPPAAAPKLPSRGPSPKPNEDDGVDIGTQQAWLAGKGPKGR